jgi:phosphoglucomutase
VASNTTHQTAGRPDTNVTTWIERATNGLLSKGLRGLRRIPYDRAIKSPQVHRHDFIGEYVADLANVVDVAAIQSSGLKLGVDPLGGASVHYWQPIIERYGIEATIVNDVIDPTFRFMTADWDGKVRMECSSSYAMAGLIGMRDRFDVAVANDTDADRHGVVTRSKGLMNPNHYLAAAVHYLYRNRPHWNADCAIGKTIVSSSVIDRVTAKLGRKLVEVPVGFKWFVEGLIGETLGFAGEESAGASFLRRDGAVWTTDKDGLVLGLLAAEMKVRTGRDPSEIYDQITQELGASFYDRLDVPATAEQKKILQALSPDEIDATIPAGEKIEAKIATAPGNGVAIGGIKVVAKSGWFAARPSGTEDVYKIYAESFIGEKHLELVQREAQELILRLWSSRSARSRCEY